MFYAISTNTTTTLSTPGSSLFLHTTDGMLNAPTSVVLMLLSISAYGLTLAAIEGVMAAPELVSGLVMQLTVGDAIFRVDQLATEIHILLNLASGGVAVVNVDYLIENITSLRNNEINDWTRLLSRIIQHVGVDHPRIQELIGAQNKLQDCLVEINKVLQDFNRF